MVDNHSHVIICSALEARNTALRLKPVLLGRGRGPFRSDSLSCPGLQESEYAWAWSLGVNLFSWYMQVRPDHLLACVISARNHSSSYCSVCQPCWHVLSLTFFVPGTKGIAADGPDA